MQYKYLDSISGKKKEEVCDLLNSFAIGVVSDLVTVRDAGVRNSILKQRADLIKKAGEISNSKGCAIKKCKTCDPNQRFSVMGNGLCKCPKK